MNEFGMPPISPKDILAQYELLRHLVKQIPWVPVLWVLAPLVTRYAKRLKPLVDLAHATAAFLSGHG